MNYSGLRVAGCAFRVAGCEVWVTRFALQFAGYAASFGGTGILDNRGSLGPPVSYVAANDADIHRATRSSQPVTLMETRDKSPTISRV